jgi:hypothetical protein
MNIGTFKYSKPKTVQIYRQKVYTAPLPPIRTINRCIKTCVVPLFALSNNFAFLYISLYTTFESETLQFTETFDRECGKNSSETF